MPGFPTAPISTRYRCFLPDLAGLAGIRRVGPGMTLSLPEVCDGCVSSVFNATRAHWNRPADCPA
jgi:hypothetical protein